MAKQNGLHLAYATVITESNEIGTYTAIASEAELIKTLYRLTIPITWCLSIFASLRVHLLRGRAVVACERQEACASKEDA